MLYKKLDQIPVEPSRIVFGCAIAPMLQGEDVNELLDAMYDLGITAYDTAENYGQSETSLGNWIRSRGNRDRLVILTKGCHPYDGKDRVTPEELRHDIEQSFERLGTDVIDIYLLHRDDTKIHPGPIVEVLNEYYRVGKIRRFGGSNWSHERIALANEYAKSHGLEPFTVSSPNFGLCEQVRDPWGGGSGSLSISGPQGEAVREWYLANRIPIFAFSSLGRGMLSGKLKSDRPQEAEQVLDPFAIKGYFCEENLQRLARAEVLAAEKGCSVSQIAMAWTLQHELAPFAIVSARSADRMRQNVEATRIILTPRERAWLDLR